MNPFEQQMVFLFTTTLTAKVKQSALKTLSHCLEKLPWIGSRAPSSRLPQVIWNKFL